MKIILYSNDIDLINLIKTTESLKQHTYSVFSDSNDPLDVMSSVISENPSIIIIDDDFLKPQSAHILKSIRKFDPNISIIFITGDASIKLGREISQIGIQFYTIKPFDKDEIVLSLESIVKMKSKKSNKFTT